MHIHRSTRGSRSHTTIRSRFTAGCALALSISISLPAFAEDAPTIDESAGVRRVCAAGPAAAQARAERLRGQAAAVSAGVLPNPELYAEHRRNLSGPDEQETTLKLSLRVGVGGRRALLLDAAEARQRQAQASAQATLLEAALGFRKAFVTAALDEARLAVLMKQQQALDGLTAMLQGLARGGESAGYALLRQQTQARLHRRLVVSMQARAAASRAMLVAWTGEDLSPAPVALNDLAGDARARASHLPASTLHPEVESLDAAAQASGLEARAARRSWVPDLTFSTAYRTVTGAGMATAHGIAVGLTVPLTIFDHGQGEAARADADRASAAASAESRRRENAARSRAAIHRLATLESGVAELDQAAVEASSLQAKAITLYSAGEASLIELLDAFRTVEETKLARLDLAEEIARGRLERMRAAGTLFDAALDRACGRGPGGER